MRFSPFSHFVSVVWPDIGVVPDIGGAVADPPSQAPTQEQQGRRRPAMSLCRPSSRGHVVNVFFNVKDKHGMLIPNLTKDDFQVMEDGKPQTIKYFSANRTSR